MKWEILKGSEKDFDGAPEWATLLTKTGGHKFFVETHAGSARAINIDAREEFKIDANPMPNQFDNIKIIAERRPITEPDVNLQVTTEWSGDGLPPVGVECEWLDNRGVYMPVKVVYSSKFALVIQGEGSLDGRVDIPLDPIMNSDKCKFRPIRSAEDVARDKAFAELEDLEKAMPDGYQPYELLDAIVLAGYRKVE